MNLPVEEIVVQLVCALWSPEEEGQEAFRHG